MDLKNILEMLGILVPVLIGGFGAYVKIREDITRLKTQVEELKSDIHQIALMIPTNRALAEEEEES